MCTTKSRRRRPASSLRLKQLVVNADDLGLASSVNRGIIDTMEQGVVRSASLMVNYPARGDAIDRLRAMRDKPSAPDVGIGLHFNIVAGRPLSRCETLCRSNGDFASLGGIAFRAFARRVASADVARELDAQIERAQQLLSALGMHLTHIDSHRHAHALPGVYDVVLERARRHGIRHVRHPRETSGIPMRRLRATLTTRAINSVLPDGKRSDDVAFTGFALMASATLPDDLVHLAASLPDGTTELMVHPGYDSEELASVDAYRKPREREVRALTSPALLERCRERGVRLTHFGRLA